MVKYCARFAEKSARPKEKKGSTQSFVYFARSALNRSVIVRNMVGSVFYLLHVNNKLHCSRRLVTLQAAQRTVIEEKTTGSVPVYIIRKRNDLFADEDHILSLYSLIFFCITAHD